MPQVVIPIRKTSSPFFLFSVVINFEKKRLIPNQPNQTSLVNKVLIRVGITHVTARSHTLRNHKLCRKDVKKLGLPQ